MSRPGSAPNGWVVYTQGQQPKATLGSRPFGRKPLVAELEAGCAMLGTLEPGQVGSVAKVQALLEAQAALFVPLELVAVAGEAGAVAGEAGRVSSRCSRPPRGRSVARAAG